METIISIAVVSILTSKPGLAQIVPDATLGNQSSRVTTGVNIKGNGADLIEGGAQRGSSLFHSFTEFNVNNGQRVYFANPTAIDNIFSRVTGNNASNILGTLGVNGGANLFLLNPNGIIFGKNAQLDIQGSFLATTANSFKFPDGSEFSATNPQAPPLLTMSVPVGVQYGLQPPASITNQGYLVTGENLTLSAGNLDLQGRLQAGGDLTLQAQDTLKVRDSASNPFIAAAAGKLLVQGNEKVDIYALNHADSGFFSGGDMVLQSKNTIGGDAHYWAGGNFRIEQLNGDLGNLFSPYDPVILASGDVSFASYEGASLHILAGGSVTISGDVKITGVDSTSNFIQESVTLSDETTIDIDGSKTPTLDIRAGVSLNKIGNPGFTPNSLIGFTPQNPQTTNTPTSADISIGGNISNISGYESNSGQILITNKYYPNGLPGDITTGVISTYGNVSIDSRGNITSNGAIDTTTSISGKNNKGAGNIRLLANQNILISGNLLSSFYNIDNNNSGYSGSIVINANEQVSINKESQISSAGFFGFIDIKSSSLFLNHNSHIETNSTNDKGSGDAGYIKINASDKISLLNGSKISSQGNYGYIKIETGSLTLNQGSQINTNNNALENPNLENQAGFITIDASDKISLLNGSKISSQGNQGSINITTQNLLLRRGSNISTTAGKEGLGGKGGDITITAQDGFVIAEPTEDSNIIANSFGGKGGKIKIIANRVLGFENSQNRGKLTPAQLENLQNNGTSDINASSDVDEDGEVAIDTLSIDPSQGLVALPANLVDPSNLIAQGCGSSNSSVAKGESKFVITGRGGLPPSPDDTLKAGVMLPEWVVGNTPKYSNNPENITVKEMNLKQLSSTVAPLVEAVGMVRNADGDIVLTAQPTTASLLQSGLSSQVCSVAQENVR